jgi:hypothetical protein
MRFLALVVLVLVAGVFPVLAEGSQEPTQQYNKIFLNPFYRASMTQNTNYTYNVTVNPPDGVDQVVSAIVTFDMWITPTVTFSAWVNGKTCNNPTYVISTTFSGSGRGVATFDCSNVIKEKGVYNVTIRATGANVGAVTAWLDLTYMNEPAGSVKVHGTEYVVGDVSKAWLQLLDNSNQYVEDAVCYVDIYYPDNSEWIERAQMTNSNHDGIYYYDVVAPNRVGVYPVIAVCYYVAVTNQRNASSYVLTSGAVESGVLSNTYVDDGVNFVLKTDKNGGLTVNNRVNVTYNFTDFFSACGTVPEALMTGITVHWNGVWTSVQANNDVTMYVFNYTGNNWMAMPNIIEGNIGSEQTVTNSLSFKNVTKALGVNATNQMRVSFINSNFNEGSKQLRNDHLHVSCDQLGSPEWQEVRGSSEFHISSSQGTLFSWETLCGDESSGCMVVDPSAVVVNNITLYEGLLVENITLMNAGLHDLTGSFVYQTPPHIDCTAFISATLYSPSPSDISSDLEFSSGPEGSCDVNIPVEFDSSQASQQVVLEFDNYLTWEIGRSRDIRESLEGLNEYCLEYAASLNVTFVIPLVNVSNATDPVLQHCERAVDDFFFFDYYDDLSQGITSVGDLESYHYEMTEYYLPKLLDAHTFIQTHNNGLLLASINVTTTSIKNDTSLIQQIWSWVQSIFTWTSTDTDQNATTSVATNIPSSLIPQSVEFVQAQYYQQQSSSIVAQLQRDGLSVNGATCSVSTFYPNMTAFVSGTMSFTGIDGMYSYAWTPDVYGSHIAQVNCSGGGLIGQVQASGSLGVSAPNSGVVMSVIG